MEIPENMCSECFDEITNRYHIKIGLCHDCMMIKIGKDWFLNQPKRLKEIGFNKHKLKELRGENGK